MIRPESVGTSVQMFTYLNSGPKNSNPLLSKVKYGLALLWPIHDPK